MMQLSLGGIRRSVAAAAAVLAVAGGGVASAAEFVTNWDPIFNPAFDTAFGTTLGWKGTATVNVPNGCLTPLSSVNNCAATLTAYTVVFYNTINNNVFYSTGQSSLTNNVSQVRVDGLGDVDGINLDGSITVAGGPFNFGTGTGFVATLDFVIDGGFNERYTGPTLTLQNCGNCLPYGSGTNPDERSTFPIVNWDRVPEPTSLALVGLALAALGLRRRRA